MIPHGWLPGDLVVYDGEVWQVWRDGDKVVSLYRHGAFQGNAEVCEGDAVNVSDLHRQVQALQETVNRLEGR